VTVYDAAGVLLGRTHDCAGVGGTDDCGPYDGVFDAVGPGAERDAPLTGQTCGRRISPRATGTTDPATVVRTTTPSTTSTRQCITDGRPISTPCSTT
jgi:hypothetical protein